MMGTIGVIGLGKLGLPLACLLSKYHTVWGHDVHTGLLDALRDGRFETFEPQCNYSRLNLTSNLDRLVDETDLAFVCVNTPTRADGTMDLSQIEAVCEELGQIESRGYGVVISSTVMPGTADDMAADWLEGAGMVVYSNPVWIALGSVIKDLSNPPVLLIGADNASHLPVLDVWSPIVNLPATNIHFTNTITAEFLKLAHNAWACTKMAFMGYLQDRHTEVDMEAVSRFFQHGGERPGAFWKLGPSFGGPCFPRDLQFWLEYTRHPLGEEVHDINLKRVRNIVDMIPSQARVLILGSGYKYGVPIVDGALSLTLADMLGERGCTVLVSDDGGDGFEADWCIVAHRELAPAAPANSKVINLW